MRLGRVIPAFEHQPELQNHDCQVCEITVTESAQQGTDERTAVTDN